MTLPDESQPEVIVICVVDTSVLIQIKRLVKIEEQWERERAVRGASDERRWGGARVHRLLLLLERDRRGCAAQSRLAWVASESPPSTSSSQPWGRNNFARQPQAECG